MGRRATTGTALFWSGSEALLRLCGFFAASVLLARLLRPEDFGAVATLQVFIGIADVFVSSGLPASLIRNHDTTREEESSVFYFNLTVAALLAGVMSLGAPHIAAFFQDPDLHGLTYAMAFNLFLTATSTVHRTLLERALDFRTITRVSVSATAISSAVAITLAYRGFGAWSLAVQALVSTGLSSALLWRLYPWRPTAHWSFTSLRKHLSFGVYILLARLLDVGSYHLNSVLIAKLFSTKDLAYFSRAQGTQQLPVALMTGVLGRVALPVFATSSKNPDQLARHMGRAQAAIMWLTVPAMLGVALVAEPLVLVLFGEKWLPSVPILEVLALAGIVLPMRVLNSNVHLALGRSELMFQMDVLKKTVSVLLTIAASFHGVLAMAWAQAISAWFAFLVNAYCTGRLVNYGILAQLKDCGMYVFLAVPMAGVLLSLRAHIGQHPWIQLIVLPCLGVVLYVGASWILGVSVAKDIVARLRRGARA